MDSYTYGDDRVLWIQAAASDNPSSSTGLYFLA